MTIVWVELISVASGIGHCDPMTRFRDFLLWTFTENLLSWWLNNQNCLYVSFLFELFSQCLLLICYQSKGKSKYAPRGSYRNRNSLHILLAKQFSWYDTNLCSLYSQAFSSQLLNFFSSSHLEVFWSTIVDPFPDFSTTLMGTKTLKTEPVFSCVFHLNYFLWNIQRFSSKVISMIFE